MKVEQYLKTVRKMSSRVIISLKHRPEGLQLNGEHIRTIDRIHAGDTLSVTMEDEDVMVYNKPVDMPCHQAKTHQQDTLANVFARDCRERGLTLSYRCINRLDRNTSGAVVVAKNAHAATVLGGVGRGGIQVHKRYTALLTGILPYERGIIDAGIARIDEETINRMVDNAGQPARTGFEVLGYGYRHTLAEFSLYTGWAILWPEMTSTAGILISSGGTPCTAGGSGSRTRSPGSGSKSLPRRRRTSWRPSAGQGCAPRRNRPIL